MIRLSISENTSVDMTTIEIARVNWRTSPSEQRHRAERDHRHEHRRHQRLQHHCVA
jgi:hypothetical protein